MTLRHALVLSLLSSAALAAAPVQLKLPGRRPEAPAPRQGDQAPHHACLACQGRNYTVIANPRLDADGNTIAWCEACKRDTSQRYVAASPAPGESRPVATDRNLKLPRPATRDVPRETPAREGAPAADVVVPAPTPASTESPAARLVFETLRSARGESEGLVVAAVDSLASLGESGLSAARRELAADDPRGFSTAARVLVRAGGASDLELVRARLLGKCPATAPAVVALIAARDPVLAGPAFLVELLEHAQAGVRQEAEKLLRRERPEERAKLATPKLASKRVETRLAAVGLVAEGRTEETLDALFGRLSDPSPKVASAVVSAIASRDDEGLDARLIAKAFASRWVLRTEAYALLAIIEREDAFLRPVLDVSHAEALLGGLETNDPFVRGATAAALAGIGFRSTDAAATAWLDRDVVDRLVDAVSGRIFFDDYSSLASAALRRLKLVSGEALGNDGPRWIEWWLGARASFWARRAALSVAPEEVASFAVRLETTGKEPEHVTLVGPAIAEEAARGAAAGDVVFLTVDEMRAIVDLARQEGLFGAELLPGSRGGTGRGERTLALGVGGRAKAFKLGPNVTEPWFERVVALVRELRDRNRWQRFPTPGKHASPLALWRADSAWWHEPHTPLERAGRMKALVFAALEGAPPALRDAGVGELARVCQIEGAVELADFTALVRALEQETHPGERSQKLVALALSAARAAGDPSAGTPPVELCEDLVRVVTRRFGDRAGADVQTILTAGGAEFARRHASDERALVRAAVARVLATDPTAPNLDALVRLLGDSDASVEIAAVTALGEHGVEAARTEILVRARLGLAPVRAAALVAAGELGGEYVLDALVQGVGDRDRTVRVAAARGLAALGEPAATAVLVSLLADENDADIYGAAREGLKRLGERALPDLVRLVHSPLARGRREAALLLAEQGSPEAASPLMAILSTSPNDSRVAAELSILSCVDHRGTEDPAQAWWAWWDGVRHDDALAWFRAGVERLGLSAPGPGALEGAGTPQGRAFLLAVMERSEAWLAERARRELARLSGTDLGALPPRGHERDAWLRGLRTKLGDGRL